MPQPCADDIHIHTLFQKANRRGVAEDMRRDTATLVWSVAVDAKSGLYMQSAVHANPEGNLLQFGSTEEVAKSIIGKVVELPNGGVRIPVRREALCQYPRLVWMPCRESLSPFYPFHMFTIGSERIYVRTDGAIFTSLRTGDRGI
jgi:hypothetical protein